MEILAKVEVYDMMIIGIKAFIGILILMSLFGGWQKLRAWIIKKRGGSDGIH